MNSSNNDKTEVTYSDEGWSDLVNLAWVIDFDENGELTDDSSNVINEQTRYLADQIIALREQLEFNLETLVGREYNTLRGRAGMARARYESSQAAYEDAIAEDRDVDKPIFPRKRKSDPATNYELIDQIRSTSLSLGKTPPL